jgi:hypothetical protein
VHLSDTPAPLPGVCCNCYLNWGAVNVALHFTPPTYGRGRTVNTLMKGAHSGRGVGLRLPLAILSALVMAVVALLLTLALSSSIVPSNAAVQRELPYTFFFTHYQLLGDPNNPDGVRYHSNGKPFAKAPDGSKVILSGKGDWNPKTDTAKGGGHYTIKGSSGALKAQGSWRVTGFRSFEQFSGWWGGGTGFQGERVAGTPWIGFLLRVSDAQGEP